MLMYQYISFPYINMGKCVIMMRLQLENYLHSYGVDGTIVG